MPNRTTGKVVAIAVMVSGVLVGGTALLLRAGKDTWPDPDSRPDPPYGLFLVVVGTGILVLGWLVLRGRRAPRLWEYGLLILIAIIATRLSTYGAGGAQQCCETGWIFGYGYPFEYRYTMWETELLIPRIGRKAAEVAARPALGDPIAHAADLVFWFYATSLAYLPARMVALRATRRTSSAH
jgi:hypothetical protein